jgi:iduronate 2-sulfatase
MSLVCIAVGLLFAFLVTGPQEANGQHVQNVLFIVSDDLRANVAGCYGDQLCKTPNIDRLAKRGMVFDRAYCQGTWCSPSRTSFMYSRYQGKSKTTLGECFIENGFYSARVGKIFHMRVPGDIIDGTDGNDVPACWTEKFNSPGQEAHTPGDYACLNLNVFTDALEGRQSTGMKHRMFVTVAHDGDGSDQPDYKTATKTIELLRKHKDERFFIATGFVRPHYPMVAPRKYFDPYPIERIEMPPQVEGDLDDIPVVGRTTTSQSTGIDKFPDNQKRMWAAYYASVQFMDEQVGRVLDELDRLGLTESTAIVFTSDHGYQLGDHTFWQKLTLHEQVARVPMIISVPGHKPGRTNSFAELVDIYPTLVKAAGIETPDEVQGVDLSPMLKDPTATVKEGALSLNKGALWRTDGWAYMQYRDGSEELYDMKADPDQITNLAKSDKHSEELARLREQWNERTATLGIKFKSPK